VGIALGDRGIGGIGARGLTTTYTAISYQQTEEEGPPSDNSLIDVKYLHFCEHFSSLLLLLLHVRWPILANRN